MKNLTNKAGMAAQMAIFSIKNELNSKRRGDFAADKGVVIAITVAIAGIALIIAYTLLKDTIGPSLTNAIKGFFNFN